MLAERLGGGPPPPEPPPKFGPTGARYRHAIRAMHPVLIAAVVVGLTEVSAQAQMRYVYYFSHIPKTGGASFADDLLAVIDQRRQGLRACAHNMDRCWGPDLSRSDTALDKLRVAAHTKACNYATCELPLQPALKRAGLHLGVPRVRVLLLVRSPAAHVVSQYAHEMNRLRNRKGFTPPSFSSWIKLKKDQVGWRNQTTWHPYNMQVAHMAGYGPGQGHGSGYGHLPPGALARAKAAVDAAFHVGVLEHYRAQYCLAVHRIWPEQSMPRPACVCGNTEQQRQALTHNDHGTHARSKVPTISARDQLILTELTLLDVQLYAHATARFMHDMRASSLPKCLMDAATV